MGTEYVILERGDNKYLTEVGEETGASATAALGNYLKVHPMADGETGSFVVVPASHWTEIPVGVDQPPPRLVMKATVRKPKQKSSKAPKVDPGQTSLTDDDVKAG